MQEVCGSLLCFCDNAFNGALEVALFLEGLDQRVTH